MEITNIQHNYYNEHNNFVSTTSVENCMTSIFPLWKSCEATYEAGSSFDTFASDRGGDANALNKCAIWYTLTSK